MVEAGSGDPISSVDVTLVDLDRRTVTTGEGRFLFPGVPAGEHTLRVRHLGFESESRTIVVDRRFELSLTVRLAPEPVEVEPLVAEVVGEPWAPELETAGYYERREIGSGDYLGPQYLTRWSGTRVSDVFRRMPRVDLRGSRRSRVEQKLVFESDQNILSSCPGEGALFYVDGAKWGRSVPTMPSTEIAAVEVYERPTDAVGLARDVGECGLVLIWTWSGPNPYQKVDLSEVGCPLPAYRKEAC